MTDFFDNPQKLLEREDVGRRPFLRAAHVVLRAFSMIPAGAHPTFLKGGILMAFRYGSSRHTSDVDFSTPDHYSEAREQSLRALLESALAMATEQLEESLHVRIQSWDVQPGRDKTFVTLHIGIGYAEPGTPAYRRLQSGCCTDVLRVDYSFFEAVPASEKLSHFGGGQLQAYALTTLVAEKLRALLQQLSRNRSRRQDIYDLWYLLGHYPTLHNTATKAEILSTLHNKCAERAVTAADDALDSADTRARTQKAYTTLANELPEGELPDFNETYDAVALWYRSLPW